MLTVVLWNSADPHRAMTSFHPGEQPLEGISADEGKSIAEICKERGVTIAAFMANFPGCCRLEGWVEGDTVPSSWDIPMIEVRLPAGDRQRGKLAELLGDDLTVYTHERGVGFRNDQQRYAA